MAGMIGSSAFAQTASVIGWSTGNPTTGLFEAVGDVAITQIDFLNDITATSDLIEIMPSFGNVRTVSIDGHGQELDGNGFGLFVIAGLLSSNDVLSISNLHIQNADVVGASDGAALYAVDSEARLDDIIFRNNNADSGGAISAFSSSNDTIVTISGTTVFESNTANDFGGAIDVGFAGAISGTVLTVSGTTTFRGNEARWGGAIDADGTTMSISGTTVFEVNATTAFGGGAINAHLSTINIGGTAIFLGNEAASEGGGAIYSADSTVNISGTTTFEGNNAAWDGGAIAAVNASMVTISGTTLFEGNWVDAGDGGAIFADDSTVTINGTTTFQGNNADWCGGAISAYNTSTVTISGTTIFEENVAVFGGAIDVGENSPLTINGSARFTNNVAEGYYSGGYHEGLGGAIHTEGLNNLNRATINLNPTAGNSIMFNGNTDDYGANAICLGGYTTLNLNPVVGSSIIFNDPISSDGPDNIVNKNGAGTVSFGGFSDYRGTTNVNAGVFRINAGATYGVGSHTFNAASGSRVELANGATLNGSSTFNAGSQLRFTGSTATLSGSVITIANSDSVYYEGISKDGASVAVTVYCSLLSGESNPFGNKAWLNVVPTSASSSGTIYTVTPKSQYSMGVAAGYSDIGLQMLTGRDEDRNTATGSDAVRWDDWYNERDRPLDADPGAFVGPTNMLNSLVLTRSIGQIVLWRQKDQSEKMGSLVPSPLVRGQCDPCSPCGKQVPSYDLWFQAFAANANVWTRDTSREGYGITRNGGIVGINTELGDNTAGGIVIGFSNPYFYDSREKIDLTDVQFGLHVESQLGNNWEAAFYVGGGMQQGDAYRKAEYLGNWFNFSGDYRGNTLSATLSLSKVLRLSKRTALRPTIAIDTENAWLYQFTEDADQSEADRTVGGWLPDQNLARRQFYRSYYDRTMARIGIMGQTGGDRWGFNGRLFYSPQIGGPTVAATPMSLVEENHKRLYSMKALPLGREFVTIGLGGHVFLDNKRTVTLFGDYNTNLFAYAATQIASLGAQFSY